MLFTDESRFTPSTCDRRERVWRSRGERYAACNIVQDDRWEIPQETFRRLIRSMPRRCQVCIQTRGGHTNYWVPFWVAAMKFHQNGLACCIIFSLRFSGCHWIHPSVGWSFNFHQTMWHPFFPNTLPSPYQYRYPGRYFPPLRSDVVSKCSFNFFEQCIYYNILNKTFNNLIELNVLYYLMNIHFKRTINIIFCNNFSVVAFNIFIASLLNKSIILFWTLVYVFVLELLKTLAGVLNFHI